MDVNERIKNLITLMEDQKTKAEHGGDVRNIVNAHDTQIAILKLLIRAIDEGYKLAKMDENDDIRPSTEAAIARANHWYARYKYEAKKVEEGENIISDLCDDFTDFATSGVPNAAPYCANQCLECVNGRGWCTWGTACRGFYPKAAKRQEADENGKV